MRLYVFLLAVTCVAFIASDQHQLLLIPMALLTAAIWVGKARANDAANELLGIAASKLVDR